MRISDWSSDVCSSDLFNANVAGAKALNAFIVETPEHALAAAKQADADRAAGTLKPLSGVPIGMKDLFATSGVQTTAASHMLERVDERRGRKMCVRTCRSRGRPDYTKNNIKETQKQN